MENEKQNELEEFDVLDLVEIEKLLEKGDNSEVLKYIDGVNLTMITYKKMVAIRDDKINKLEAENEQFQNAAQLLLLSDAAVKDFAAGVLISVIKQAGGQK